MENQDGVYLEGLEMLSLVSQMAKTFLKKINAIYACILNQWLKYHLFPIEVQLERVYQ